MGEEFKEFPCYRYHPTEGQRRFETAEELEAAGENWFDHPNGAINAAAAKAAPEAPAAPADVPTPAAAAPPVVPPTITPEEAAALPTGEPPAGAAPEGEVPPAESSSKEDAEEQPGANVEDEKQADVMPKKRDIERMSKVDLQALCTKLRIVWTAEMTNEQLRSAILEIIR